MRIYNFRKYGKYFKQLKRDTRHTFSGRDQLLEKVI